MSTITLHLGLDVHKDSITIAIANAGPKGEIRRKDRDSARNYPFQTPPGYTLSDVADEADAPDG